MMELVHPPLLNKQTLSEADICEKFITPALSQSGLVCADLRQRVITSQSTQTEALVETAVG
jgi:hypothetical protein